jgi:hypothetical protein
MVGTEYKFDWYAVADSSEVQQGDFFSNVPITSPPLHLFEAVGDTIESPEAEYKLFDVIVMTQSCDFAKLMETDSVVLCPRYSFTDYVNSNNYNVKNEWNQLRMGRKVNGHLLDKCNIEHFPLDYQVIDLRNILTVPYFFIKRLAESQNPRVRLLPPYREHLAQAFARQFMRVGLPVDLPHDYPY